MNIHQKSMHQNCWVGQQSMKPSSNPLWSIFILINISEIVVPKMPGMFSRDSIKNNLLHETSLLYLHNLLVLAVGELQKIRLKLLKSTEQHKEDPDEAERRIIKTDFKKHCWKLSVYTHTHSCAVRYGFGRGITLACLIHNCFPSFWSETWKREFCLEKKQNGWTHQYPDNNAYSAGIRRERGQKRQTS